MELIDTHAHLYLDQFDADRKEMVARALKAGIGKIFLPNIDSSTIMPMLSMRNDFPGVCYPMMGLHPTSVRKNFMEELNVVEEYLQRESFIGIGETGIDLYWDKTFFSEQQEAFIYQIGLAKKFNIPIVIHARESFTQIFEILDNYMDDRLTGVFHSFTGGVDEIRKINQYGFYFGINGIVTFKNSGLDKILPSIPPDKLLLETDSPYLAPVPNRGKRNESEYAMHIAYKISEILGRSVEDIASVTTSNALNLFKMQT